MGWEKRPGGRYYYRKVRRGGRVVSEYVGTGVMAQAIAELLEEDRLERELERRQREREREDFAATDRMLAAREDTVRALVRGFLVAYGYHTHKGQWRKRRECQSKTTKPSS